MKKVRIELDYDIGDLVYLVTDPEQCLRMVTSILLGPNSVMYIVSCGHETSEHYAIELSSTPKLS